MIFGFCFISFYQERKAIRAVSGFKNLLPDVSWVIRDGKESSISADQLVLGDIIRIKNGTRVPADARILVRNFEKFFDFKDLGCFRCVGKSFLEILEI